MAKYFEEELLACKWEEEITNRLSWNLFKDQERWIDLYGSHGDKSNPRIREGFLNVFEEKFNESVAWLAITIAENLIDGYVKDGIDLDPAMAYWFNELRGVKPGEEGYVEGVIYPGDKEKQ